MLPENANSVSHSWVYNEEGQTYPYLLLSSCAFLILLMFVYFWERDKERESDRETEGEQGRDTERGRHNPKQAPGSELSAKSPTWASNSQIVRSWPELTLNRLNHPGAPLKNFFFVFIFERERQSVSGGERETQNPKQASSSELLVQSLMRGSNSQMVISWPEPKSDT